MKMKVSRSSPLTKQRSYSQRKTALPCCVAVCFSAAMAAQMNVASIMGRFPEHVRDS